MSQCRFVLWELKAGGGVDGVGARGGFEGAEGRTGYMRVGDSRRKLASNDLAVLVLWATAGVPLHTVTNRQYGFHWDEVATLDDSRLVECCYVACPPVTPTSCIHSV
jgi:hypothetical protein